MSPASGADPSGAGEKRRLVLFSRRARKRRTAASTRASWGPFKARLKRGVRMKLPSFQATWEGRGIRLWGGISAAPLPVEMRKTRKETAGPSGNFFMSGFLEELAQNVIYPTR